MWEKLTDEICENVGASVHLYFVKPLRKTVEGGLAADVVDEDEGVGRAVVALRDGAEPLLSRRVPDLKLKHQ